MSRPSVNILGFGFIEVACDGETTWIADLEAFNGRFVGGNVDVEAFAFGFDGQQEDEAEAFAVVRLKPGG